MIPFPYRNSDYTYLLPQEQIAKFPCEPRDHSRLLRVDRATGLLTEIPFYRMVEFLKAGDHLLCNNAKVLPARLFGKRLTGGVTEILLTRSLGNGLWETLAKPKNRLKVGERITFSETLSCDIVKLSPDPGITVQFHSPLPLEAEIERHGELPLPPYIKRPYAHEEDSKRYQTLFAEKPGAVAAPTAGLHFTPSILDTLREKEIGVSSVTLDISLGTFKPVQVDDIRTHPIHTESYHLSEDVAERLRHPNPNSSLVCIGTTTCRVIEASAQHHYTPGHYETNLFIYPGYSFKQPYSLITNFHAPNSTLLMLTCAFGGYELIMHAYQEALARGFRFLSFGDAMWIV